jgi:hydrogenase maturation factor HypE
MKQNTGLETGKAPMPYHVSSVAYGGGAVSTTATVYGVAATDVIQATLNAATAAANVIRAERTAANTVTITFDINPGANTRIGLVVWRP